MLEKIEDYMEMKEQFWSDLSDELAEKISSKHSLVISVVLWFVFDFTRKLVHYSGILCVVFMIVAAFIKKTKK